MKPRFILYRRQGTYYSEDTQTRKQQSLRTKDEAEAQTLLHSKNEAFRQPILNQQIALAYLSASDGDAAKRAWRVVMDEITATKSGDTPARYVTALAHKVAVSRRQLFRELEAVLNTTSKALIRSVRLERAAQLLVQ